MRTCEHCGADLTERLRKGWLFIWRTKFFCSNAHMNEYVARA